MRRVREVCVALQFYLATELVCPWDLQSTLKSVLDIGAKIDVHPFFAAAHAHL